MGCGYSCQDLLRLDWKCKINISNSLSVEVILQ